MFTTGIVVELIVKSTLMLGSAWLLAFVLRKHCARARMLVWRSAAASLLFLPVLSLVLARLTAVQFPLLPAFRLTTGATAAQAAGAAGDFAFSIIFVWAGVAGVLLLRIAAAHFLIWRAIRKDIGKRGQEFITSSRIAGPVAWGILRPSILLPASSISWDPERLEIVVAHEREHVQSRDCFWQFVAQVASAIYWFHPLVWLLLARLRDETEFACDEALLALGFRPSAYAETLLAFASATAQIDRLCPVTVAVARRTTIGRRIERILNMENTQKFTRLSACAALLAFALVLPVAAMQSGKADDSIYSIGGDVKPPVVAYKEEPAYTKEARDAKIQGAVVLQIVITSEGHVTNVEVLTGLDAGLDQNAIDAVKNWQFQPATKAGKPVNVKARIEVNFRLV